MADEIEPSWPDERDEIIEKVQRGEMSPSVADALVAERKLQPLEWEPDPTKFDPMNEPFWTLLMAMAWIAYRSPDYVRKTWNKYREKCWKWGPCRRWRAPSPDGGSFVEYKGHFLENETDASFDLLCLEEIVSRSRAPVSDDAPGPGLGHCDVVERRRVDPARVDAAREGLQKALCEGTIAATGLPSGESIRKPITAFEWQDLTMFDSNQDQDRVSRNGAQAAYDDVTLGCSEVLRLWPEMAVKAQRSDEDIQRLIRAEEARRGAPPPLNWWKDISPEIRQRVTRRRYEAGWRTIYCDRVTRRGRPAK